MNTVRTRVLAAISEVADAPVDSLTDELVLAADLDLDSLAAAELRLIIEDDLDIRLPEEVVADVKTVGDVIRVVRQAVDGGAPSA